MSCLSHLLQIAWAIGLCREPATLSILSICSPWRDKTKPPTDFFGRTGMDGVGLKTDTPVTNKVESKTTTCCSEMQRVPDATNQDAGVLNSDTMRVQRVLKQERSRQGDALPRDNVSCASNTGGLLQGRLVVRASTNYEHRSSATSVSVFNRSTANLFYVVLPYRTVQYRILITLRDRTVPSLAVAYHATPYNLQYLTASPLRCRYLTLSYRTS